jgi:hypothetical protein
MARSRFLVSLALLGCVSVARASSLYVSVGDGQLRSDLKLLADAGIIRLSTMAWPMPRADVARALGDARITGDTGLAIVLGRVRAAVLGPAPTSGVRLVGGHPARLRDFDTPGREDANVTVWTTTGDANWSATGVVSWVNDPADRHPVRLDGSEFTMHVGNWLLSINALDRWWGPGTGNSLIVSNNARPVPGISIDRAESLPPRWRGLHWIGPWRLTSFLGQMDGSRHDVPRPLLWGVRLELDPQPWMQIGLERVSMFCGEHRPCGPHAWWSMLIGKYADNNNVSDAVNPGDSLAGFELRFTLPSRVPVSLYSQLTAEDVGKFIPFKYLGLFGLEAAGATHGGGAWRGFAEYSNSTCSFYRDSYNTARPPLFGCAYDHHLFNVEGYRYLGRAVGASTDNDSRLYTFGFRLAPSRGGEWTTKYLAGDLNRGSDPLNELTPLRTYYRAAEVGWGGKLGHYGTLGLRAGAERWQPQGSARHTNGYGFVDWQLPL